jgi:hypothetical protein
MKSIEVSDVGLDDVDLRALQDALTICRAFNPARAAQLDAFLTERPWFEVARFCAAFAQTRSLGLTPAQTPPAYIDPNNPKPGEEVMRAFLIRMEAAGVSAFDPNPLQAVEAAEAAGERPGSQQARFSAAAAPRGKAHRRPSGKAA